ncbi:MAG: hypothetical protein ACF8R9_09585 [Phycisphaerales bacterium JB054]
MLHRALIGLVAGLTAAGLLCFAGCTSSGGSGSGGAGGFHLPRPVLRANVAHLPTLSGPATTDDNARVEILAINPTDAPLWLRKLSITLRHNERALAAGDWQGDRQIDPGTSVLLDISLPLVEGAQPPAGGTAGMLTVETRYARSGLIGLMGGESHTYTLPVTLTTEP